MLRPAALLAIALILGSDPVDSAAQDSACTYDRCALGIHHGFWSTRIVQGSRRASIASIGMLAPPLQLLETRSDSARAHYRAFRSAHNTGFWLQLIAGLALVANTVVTLQSDVDEVAFVGTGALALGFGLWGSERRRAASNSLDQAFWWYNRTLPPDAGTSATMPGWFPNVPAPPRSHLASGPDLHHLSPSNR